LIPSSFRRHHSALGREYNKKYLALKELITSAAFDGRLTGEVFVCAADVVKARQENYCSSLW